MLESGGPRLSTMPRTSKIADSARHAGTPPARNRESRDTRMQFTLQILLVSCFVGCERRSSEDCWPCSGKSTWGCLRKQTGVPAYLTRIAGRGDGWPIESFYGRDLRVCAGFNNSDKTEYPGETYL